MTVFNRGHLFDFDLKITLLFQTMCQISATKNCYRSRKIMRLCLFIITKSLALNFQSKQPQPLEKAAKAPYKMRKLSISTQQLCAVKGNN